MVKKGKLLISAVLLLCCIGGCGKREEKEAGFSGDVTTPEGDTDILVENVEQEPAGSVIMEQSFEVELDGWGIITFVSIAPEDQKGAPRFVLEKAGAVVYTFPEDNNLRSDEFVDVSAVSFTDYNGDGKKDVIVLIQYQNGSELWNEAQIFLQENSDSMFYMDYPDLESYRIDTPAEQGPAFYRDSYLEEYLLTRGLTDTVSSVKGTWTDYIEYVDGLHGYISIDRQLALLAKCRDVWVVPIEYADERYCFTVTDLDHDGWLEVIAANQGGTGNYTYSRFYEMGADGNLKELETSFMEGDSQPDLIEEQVTVYSSFSPTGMLDYYILYDEIKTAPDCYVYRLTSLCMMNDSIMEIPLASQTVTYEGEDHAPYAVWEDYNGNPLTEEEFWNFPETYYSGLGLSQKTVSLHWMDVKELTGKNDEEAAGLLRQVYG